MAALFAGWHDSSFIKHTAKRRQEVTEFIQAANGRLSFHLPQLVELPAPDASPLFLMRIGSSFEFGLVLKSWQWVVERVF